MNDRFPPESTVLKKPPHSIDAEQAILSAIMLNADSMLEVQDILAPEMFYRREHRLIWDAMVELSGNQSPVDVLTISNYLKAASELQDAGGIDYLGELVSSNWGFANIAHYAGMIRDKALERQLIGIAHSIADNGYFGTEPVLEKIAKAQTSFMQLAGLDQKKDATHVNKAMLAAINKIETRQQNKIAAGISTGFRDVDKLIGGLRPSEEIIIAGLPSSGKSTLLQNMIEYNVLAGKNVLFFSIEMPEEMVMQRHIASVGKILLDQLINNNIDNNDMFDSMGEVFRKFQDRFYHIDDDPALQSTQILSRAQRIIVKTGRPLDLIGLDYMQKCNDPGKSPNERLEAISGNIKRAARILGCPVVALSQLSRDVAKRADKRPVNSDLRDSGALEQDADVIMFTHNPSGDDENSPWANIGELIVGKNRNGPKGKIYVTKRFEYARFENFFGPLPGQSNYKKTNTELSYEN